MTTDARAGIVLAGGFSTRFEDGDKALARLDGEPLLAHAVRGVAPPVDRLVVSCREAQLTSFQPILEDATVDAAAVSDPIPDRGPAAGIASAARHVEASRIAVVAADMPFVDGAFLGWLFDRLDGTDAVVPELDGRRQPTHAVYTTAALGQAATDAVENGDGSLRAVLDRLDVTVVPDATVRSRAADGAFRDVDTTADLARLAADRGKR